MAKEGIFCLGTIVGALVIVEMPKSNSNFEEYSVFISVVIAKMFLLQKKTYKSVASCGKVASSILVSCERRVAQWKSVPQEIIIMEFSDL